MNTADYNTEITFAKAAIGRRRRWTPAVTLAVAISSLLIGCLPASAATNSASKSKSCKSSNGLNITSSEICKGLAYFRGQTVTIIAPGPPAGQFDDTAASIQPFLGSFLGATVNILMSPTGNTITGQDAAEAAPPTGQTVGMLNLLADASDVLTNQPGLNFNPKRVATLEGTGATPSVLVSSPGSPYTSFASLVASKTPISMLTVTSGSVNTIYRAWMGALGIDVHFISGYSNAAIDVSGLVRGDGPVTYSGLTNLGSFIAGGQARPLAINTPVPVGTMYRKYVDNLPTIAATLKQYGPKTKSAQKVISAMEAANSIGGPAYFYQTKVPQDRVLAMEAAMAWGMHQSAYKTSMLNDDLNPKIYSPAQVKASYVSATKDGLPLVPFING